MTTSPKRYILFPLLLAVLGMVLAWLAATTGDVAQRARARSSRELEVVRAQKELLQGRADSVAGDEIEKRSKRVAEAERKLRDAPADRGAFTEFGRPFAEWDGWRYEEIADQGYVYHQKDAPQSEKDDPTVYFSDAPPRQKNVVWYPLYPMMGRGLARVLHIEAVHALTVVSWTCCALAAVGLFHYSRLRAAVPGADNERAATCTLLLLLFGPCSIFLYANFTESLFTLLLVMFLICLHQRWWWRAALIAAVASACRSQGVLFGPILALVYLWRMKDAWPKRLGIAFVLGLIASIGLASYMAFLARAFGDPIAFMHAQVYWDVGINRERLLYVANPLHALQWAWWMLMRKEFYLPMVWESLCVIWPPILLIAARRKLSFELAVIGWLLWALPYVSNSMASHMDHRWMSMGRFMAVLLPAYLVMGDALARRPRLAPFVLVPSAGMFLLFAYMFGTGAWLG